MSKISQQIRQQTPSVHRWKRELRSRSPSPSRLPVTEGKGGYLTDVQSKSSALMKKDSSMSKSLRKNNSSLAASISLHGKASKNNDMSNVEGEYIKNLQQQIYFLELETNYLREQAMKATEMHPRMTSEAENMLAKLREMQYEMDAVQSEMRHKDATVEVTKAEKNQMEDTHRNNKSNWDREKRLLTEEIITVKKEKDRMEREVSRKDTQLIEAKSEIDKSASAIKNAEFQLTTLKSQLDQRIEQHKMTQLSLDEKRSELLASETQLREIEEKYYSSSVNIHDKVTQDLREEICYLRQKLKETELEAQKDRYMRDKMSEDSSSLVKENALLNQQLTEIQKQIERERGLRESNEQRHSLNIVELVSSRDKEKQLQFEIEELKDRLRRETEKSQHFMEEMTKKDVHESSIEKKLRYAQERVSELESSQVAADSDHAQLRKDKMLLVDHVADLQSKLEERDLELMQLQQQTVSLDARLNDYDKEKNMEHTLQSQKWEEFGRLAESMRTLSSTMAVQSQTPRGTSRILRF